LVKEKAQREYVAKDTDAEGKCYGERYFQLISPFMQRELFLEDTK